MDKNNLAQIFSYYIDKFAYINNEENREYYKWQVCYEFHDIMDAALRADDEDFSDALYQAKVCSANIIDNFTQPFYGLVKFAQEEPAVVKQMFQELYEDDHGDLQIRMKKIEVFFDKSEQLLEKYYSGSYLYKQNSHSVSAYLFLYKPEEHYMYKANECKTMADCVGFYDSWGTGNMISLEVFYRMCDEILAEIKNCPELLRTNESRFDGRLKLRPGKLHPDENKHILLFDIMYCCRTYELFDLVPFARPNTKEKQLIKEYRQKAVRLKQGYDEAYGRFEQLEEALDYVVATLKPSTPVKHRKYGMGTVTKITRKDIYVKFDATQENTQLGLSIVVAKGILQYDNPDYIEKIDTYKEVLSKAESIPKILDYAAKELKPYEEYLQ